MRDWLLGRKAPDNPKDLAVPPITEAVRAEARATPGGWVYVIGGGFGRAEAVPPQAVRGAWKVDAAGEIEGAFLPNPKYDPSVTKEA